MTHLNKRNASHKLKSKTVTVKCPLNHAKIAETIMIKLGLPSNLQARLALVTAWNTKSNNHKRLMKGNKNVVTDAVSVELTTW